MRFLKIKKKGKNLDQFLTYKRQILDQFLTLQHIYIERERAWIWEFRYNHVMEPQQQRFRIRLGFSAQASSAGGNGLFEQQKGQEHIMHMGPGVKAMDWARQGWLHKRTRREKWQCTCGKTNFWDTPKCRACCSDLSHVVVLSLNLAPPRVPRALGNVGEKQMEREKAALKASRVKAPADGPLSFFFGFTALSTATWNAKHQKSLERVKDIDTCLQGLPDEAELKQQLPSSTTAIPSWRRRNRRLRRHKRTCKQHCRPTKKLG